MNKRGYIAVDLDGTLAFYDTWKGVEHIGDPIPLMAERVRDWLELDDYDVVIFTARVAPDSPDRERAEKFIQDWTERHFGKRLRVTAYKTFACTRIYDDRAIGVIENTGVLVTRKGR